MGWHVFWSASGFAGAAGGVIVDGTKWYDKQVSEVEARPVGSPVEREVNRCATYVQ